MAKDSYYPSYIGEIAHVSLYFCDGAYNAQFKPSNSPRGIPTDNVSSIKPEFNKPRGVPKTPGEEPIVPAEKPKEEPDAPA